MTPRARHDDHRRQPPLSWRVRVVQYGLAAGLGVLARVVGKFSRTG